MLEAELKKFNWGAFLLNWIWGIFHGKYITLLYFPACLIPVVGPLFVSIWFGVYGNKWAWDARDWTDIADFRRIQHNWVKLWFVLFVLAIIISVKVIFIFMVISNIQLS